MMINGGLLPVTRILYQYRVLQHVTLFPIFRSFPWDLTELVFFLFSKEKNIPLHFLEIESTGARPFTKEPPLSDWGLHESAALRSEWSGGSFPWRKMGAVFEVFVQQCANTAAPTKRTSSIRKQQTTAALQYLILWKDMNLTLMWDSAWVWEKCVRMRSRSSWHWNVLHMCIYMSNLENPRFTERTSTNLGRSHRLPHVCTIMIYGKLGGYRLQETAAFIYIYIYVMNYE